jgi:hypothetical protein
MERRPRSIRVSCVNGCPTTVTGRTLSGCRTIDNRDKVLKWIKKYSPIEHVTKDDPPIGLSYGGDKDVKVGDSPKDPTHSPILGIKLEEKLKATGVEVILVYPGRPSEKYKSSADYLIDRLLQK